MQVNIPIIHGSSKCVRFFAFLPCFTQKKATVRRQKKNDIFVKDPGIAPRMGFEVDTSKKVEHSFRPKTFRHLGILSKIPHVSGRSKVGNSLASVQAWKKAMSSVVHLQGVEFFFLFREVDSKKTS